MGRKKKREKKRGRDKGRAGPQTHTEHTKNERRGAGLMDPTAAELPKNVLLLFSFSLRLSLSLFLHSSIYFFLILRELPFSSGLLLLFCIDVCPAAPLPRAHFRDRKREEIRISLPAYMLRIIVLHTHTKKKLLARLL